MNERKCRRRNTGIVDVEEKKKKAECRGKEEKSYRKVCLNVVRTLRRGDKVPRTYDEIKAMTDKQIEDDKARQLVIMNLVVEYDNACEAKDDLQKEYDECNDIPQETTALIDTFLIEDSDKDYEMHNSLF
ncbi:hypothetical protein Tco_0649955 [Tanacetum coccineum]